MTDADSRPAVVGQVEPSVGRLFPQREDDRALLESAAAAIGMRVYDWMPGRAGFAHGDSITNRWNPLFDDGDAFRLALALRISVWRGDDDRPLYGVTHWMPQPPPPGEKP